MHAILDEAPSVRDAPDAVELPPVSEGITFRDLDFAYDGKNFVFRGVDLDVRFGETVAFVGPTGAGKSSLMKLVSRMYDPQAGEIRIDGHDIRGVTLASLRRQMGIVLQESFLFAGAIRENIRYGRPEASDEEVIAAARLANADTFIRELPEGYDTDVHERGVKLSAGQRQLVAFARALLVQPRILILDEATSSVDPFTELHVQEALERLLRDRIALVVAHRLSTIVHADKICVVLNGGIAAQGRHEELLQTSPLYASLYQRRFLPGEAEAPAEVTA
jgi:ABC-type multidrug transport system fused ATPase/permease subunit